MAKDRQGCRTLQQKIDNCDQVERNVIMNSLIPHLDELVYDLSSNYVIQKLCEYLTGDAHKRFLNFFLSDLHKIIEQQSSCRVLQKYMENTTKENVEVIYEALKSNIIPMCSSPNGNHIIQRFIEILPHRLDEMVEMLKPHVISLVVDNCGCRVIQKLFDKYPIERLRPLVDEVLGYANELATDQYGNYVVQNILESGTDNDFAVLLKDFSGSFYQFSIHKFASNVIEKCIRRANSYQRNEIFNEIIGYDDEFEEERIAKMVGDQFGNYVIQRIIEFGSESQQTAIYNVVYEKYDELCRITYAKHVIIRLSNLGYEF
ncbi:Pumilio-family RNA binding repeat containing protein [Histomonas meleagridis]|uniref:Pumilio-family RNA binding repeat containing protein n=1 Tax=Histomonas meleagridis TaxID=135588 RepID=UPI00355AC029|nr:Pumilio-family RNA binding repeat containing protein [Histomonas meleagridis]KAH0804476.1 Pumilio-family RNA binding repeat containing protein [Histomonas meleagridis]